jgi:tRNA G18 (ribose-2'-O)-methylase SpoU
MEQTHEKPKVAKTYPISIATINFLHDGNIGFLIRSAACFGAECVHIVGPTPSRETIQALSEALGDYVKIKQHSSPKKFVDHTQQEGYNLVCVAPGAESEPLSTYTFDFSKPVCIVVGHEETGVPWIIIKSAKIQ